MPAAGRPSTPFTSFRPARDHSIPIAPAPCERLSPTASQPVRPADDAVAMEGKGTALRRCQHIRKNLRQRLPLQIDIGTRTSHRRVEACVTEPLADGGKVDACLEQMDRRGSIEQHLADYERFLQDARALSRQTIINYRPVVRDFLSYRFGDGEVMLAHLRAIDVTNFVQKTVSRLNMRRAKITTTALRSFLAYARYRGDIASDLAAAVPVVANWSLSSIPRAIGHDAVTRLLARSIEIRRSDAATMRWSLHWRDWA